MASKSKVMIAPAAQRQIRKLDGVMLPRVVSCLKMLAEDNHPIGVEKLQQNPNFWRLKVGPVKIIYTVIGQNQTIIVAIVTVQAEPNEAVVQLKECSRPAAPAANEVTASAGRTRH